MKKSEKLLLNRIKKIIEETSDIDTQTLADKLNITNDECIELLNNLGIDIINENINDELKECEELITDDDKKKKIFELIKKEISINKISEITSLSELEIAGIINELKESGYNILNVIKNNENIVINLGNESLRKNYIHNIPDINEDFTFLAISDTRLCSYYQQLGILNEIYKIAFSSGAKFVLHCGDITEGIYKNKMFKDTIFAHDTFAQKEYVINNYPFIEDFNTYFLTGDKDATLNRESTENIGKLIANDRKDLIYLGQNRAIVKVGNTNILMRHPKGKVAYTISYKSQRHIASLRSEDKVNIILNGHWCYMDEYIKRRIHQFSIPCLVAQTPEMDLNDIPNTVGAYLINVKLDKKGLFKKTTYRRICYYQTLKNEDYRRVKPLNIKKDSEEYKKLCLKRENIQ